MGLEVISNFRNSLLEKVKIRSYASPTLILLAYDWSDGRARDDLLGFAIERKPGFYGQARSWLPNRIGFKGPAPGGKDLPSNENPIQKFMWWDARIDEENREETFMYTVTPMVGSENDFHLLQDAASSIGVTLPSSVNQGIGSYFNRSVVSSQAFSRKFGKVTEGNLGTALTWLANGLEKVIPSFISGSCDCEGAIYHLTDQRWVIPSFENRSGGTSLVFNSTSKDHTNDPAVKELESNPRIKLVPRSKAAIMHNKFLVKLSKEEPSALLMGSANFTTEGLTTQANVLHTFQSPELAELYLTRKRLLAKDLPVAETAKQAVWSKSVTIGKANIRVFFSPEPSKSRSSIDRIVSSVKDAKRSVIFCLFSPTDAQLRHAIFDAGDAGKMMFGLINKISPSETSTKAKQNAEQVAQVEIYHRSQENKDVYSHSLYAEEKYPEGFWWEISSLPGDAAKFPVYIHHKFVVIDAETDAPIIYTGSANMSGNSIHRNDENLLEIRNSPQLGAVYLAEFFRLYEHYRARARWNSWKQGEKTYELQKDGSWAKKAYTAGTPECKSRVNMATG
jgi:hypothetical protein